MKSLGYVVGALIALTASAASAGVVTASGTVMSDTGLFGYSAYRLNNQSGLSAGYVSGVTDFLAYTSANPTHSGSSGGNGFLANAGVSVDFDLGATYLLSDLALWNDVDFQGTKLFTVRIADNAAFTGAVSLGSYSATYGPASGAIGAQLFDLADATGRYVRVTFDSNHSSGSMTNPYVNVGELVFGVQAASNVPEPASLALVGLSLAGLALSRRRKR